MDEFLFLLHFIQKIKKIYFINISRIIFITMIIHLITFRKKKLEWLILENFNTTVALSEQQQQKTLEPRELGILHEEDENRKQNHGCDNISRQSLIVNDHSDSKKLQNRNLKKKGRKLRKKMNKVECESMQKEEENSKNLKKISYDGDDEVSCIILMIISYHMIWSYHLFSLKIEIYLIIKYILSLEIEIVL